VIDRSGEPLFVLRPSAARAFCAPARRPCFLLLPSVTVRVDAVLAADNYRV